MLGSREVAMPFETLAVRRHRDVYEVDLRVSAKGGVVAAEVRRLEFLAIDPRGGVPHRVLFAVPKRSFPAPFKVTPSKSVKRTIAFRCPRSLPRDVAVILSIRGDYIGGTLENDMLDQHRVTIERRH